MSVETNETDRPGDEEPVHGRHSFFRSADSGADAADVTDDDTDLHDDDLEDDDLDDDDDVVTGRDVDAEDDGVVQGTVVEEDEEEDIVSTPSAWETTDRYPADADPVTADAADEAQPTFTPVADGEPVNGTALDGTALDGTAVDSPAVDSSVDPTAPTLNETDDVPVVAEPVVADPAATSAPVAPVAAVNANEPLLGDPVGLRASWQQAQAGFVDDPRAAVADAAELVEHTAQTLIGALQQRQRQLRDQWDNNGSAGAPATGADTGVSDTEQLRHLMQDYRSLFNQLVQQ